MKISPEDDVERLIGQISGKKPDLVEFRTDNLNDLSILEMIALKKTFPAIVTDKATRDPATKMKLLKMAAASRFEFVDIDLDSNAVDEQLEQIRAGTAKTIISFHDWSRTPSLHELTNILNSAKKKGGEIYKIVTTAVQPRDNLTILNFLEKMSTEIPLVSFAMGSTGVISRILSPLFGSQFTFAALNDESKTADGQLGIDNLRNVWRILGLQ